MSKPTRQELEALIRPDSPALALLHRLLSNRSRVHLGSFRNIGPEGLGKLQGQLAEIDQLSHDLPSLLREAWQGWEETRDNAPD